MILFFKTPQTSVIATQADHQLAENEVKELCWLYGNAELLSDQTLTGYYVGPRREMVTPWSTNAVEITQNMGLSGILRIEEYFPVAGEDAEHDPMLQRVQPRGLHQQGFTPWSSNGQIVRSSGSILILQIGLRIEGNEREPAGLHLDHQPVPGQEIMVDVRHRERHPEFLPVLCRNR